MQHVNMCVRKVNCLQFQNYSRVLDVMPNNFQCADRRSSLHFVPILLYKQEKSENGLAHILIKFFL